MPHAGCRDAHGERHTRQHGQAQDGGTHRAEQAEAQAAHHRVWAFLKEVSGDDVHATCVLSVSNTVAAVVTAATVAIHTMAHTAVQRRATSLAQNASDKAALDSDQERFQQWLIDNLVGLLDPAVAVTMLASRGFGDKCFQGERCPGLFFA